MPLFGKRKAEQAEKLEAERVLEDLSRADPAARKWSPEVRNAYAAVTLWMERSMPGDAAHLLQVLESYKGHVWGGGKRADVLEIFSQCVREDMPIVKIGGHEVVLDGAPYGSHMGEFVLGPPPDFWGDPQGLLQVRVHMYIHVVAKFDDDLFALSGHRENEARLEAGRRALLASAVSTGFRSKSKISRRRIEKMAGR